MIPVLAAIMMAAAPAPADTVSGCLAKGDKAGTYTITSGGKATNVMSKSVKLDGHVGHTVTLTGSMDKNGDFDATKLAMKSASCM
ncbi:MAG TPA: hypothetical protein VFA43_18535 [Gemmatimonadaceae bacterium]|nr:hypothetical protein [Gemmatimonadaceae bacterium]